MAPDPIPTDPMPTDPMLTDPTAGLASALRAALHADEIEAGELRRPSLAPRPRHPHVVLLAASIAVLLAIGGLVGILVVNHGGDGPPAGGRPPGFVGYEWNVTAITDAHGTLAVPPGFGARVAFDAKGTVLGSDSVNAVFGRYEVSGDGYSVRDGATTLVAPAVGDATRDRVTAAVDELFLAPALSGGSLHVSAALSGDQLRLTSVAGVTVTLTRAGPQAPISAASATQSGTAPTAASGAITGRLLLSGGPAGTPAHPTAGSVQVNGVAGNVSSDSGTSVGSDGTFTLRVPPGNYSVTGTVAGRSATCAAPGPGVAVRSGATAHIDVLCAIK